MATIPHAARLTPGVRVHEALLACGALSSVVYVVNNVVCAMVWSDYSSFSQAISELSAIDAPSRSLWLPIGFLYAALLFAFGVGVWQSARGRRSARVTAAMLMAVGGFPYWPPMHMRGQVATLTDTMHAVVAAVISVMILIAIGFGSKMFSRRFRLYSLATIALLIVSGSATFMYAPRLAANLPTPGFGAIERVNLAAFLAWVAVLSIGLVRAEARRST